MEPEGPGKAVGTAMPQGNPAALAQVGTEWEHNVNRVVLPRTVSVTPAGKLGGGFLQDLPCGPSLGRKGQVVSPPNRKALESLRSASGGRIINKQTNREQPSPSLTLSTISIFRQYFHPKLEGKHEKAPVCEQLFFKSQTTWKCFLSEEFHTEANPQFCRHSCQKLVPQCFNYHISASKGVCVSEHSVHITTRVPVPKGYF